MRVSLYQNRRRLFSGTATQVTLPGAEGELSVLSFHAPMLCVLTEGDLQIDQVRFPVRGGLVRMARNAMTILAS